MTTTEPIAAPTDEALEMTLRAALVAAEPHYREAIALQVEGGNAAEHWAAFRRITARAIVLARLEAIASTLDGRVAIEPGYEAADVPDRFAEEPDVLESIVIAPFREAVASFEGRVPRLASTVRRLIGLAARVADAIAATEQVRAGVSVLRTFRTSFFVTGVDLPTARDIRKALADVIRGKEPADLPAFIDKAQAAGASNLTAARLETVYRNNISRAFNDGRVESVIENPAVRNLFPLLELVENRDKRTRGNPAGLYPNQGVHFQMNGYVSTPDEFRRLRIVPPSGHNCRGGTRPIPLAEALQRGFVDDNGNVLWEAVRRHNGARQGMIDSGRYPDPGWAG